MATQTKRDQRRLEILAVAARLFNERGYDAVSIRDLAQAAGVSSGTLYWYTESKQGLLQAIHEATHGELVARFERVSANDLEPEARFRAFVHEGAEHAATRRNEAAVFTRERRRLDQAYVESIPDIERMDQMIKDVLAEGAAQELWPAKNILAARMGLWSIVNFIPEWYQEDGRLTIDEIADEFANLLIGGLRAG